jgi:hypothetical protein
MTTTFKDRIGLEDLRVGVGTFERRSSTGAIVTVTKIHGIGDTGAAAPTTGEWVVGDVRWNSTPSAGGYMGWVCIAAGTPGTWKGWGLIQV